MLKGPQGSDKQFTIAKTDNSKEYQDGATYIDRNRNLDMKTFTIPNVEATSRTSVSNLPINNVTNNIQKILETPIQSPPMPTEAVKSHSLFDIANTFNNSWTESLLTPKVNLTDNSQSEFNRSVGGLFGLGNQIMSNANQGYKFNPSESN